MTTMPNGPADNSPTCPACGLYASVHGCTALRCATDGRAIDPAWKGGKITIGVKVYPVAEVAERLLAANVEWVKMEPFGPGPITSDGRHAMPEEVRAAVAELSMEEPISRSEMKRRVLMRGGSEEELREASRYVPPSQRKGPR